MTSLYQKAAVAAERTPRLLGLGRSIFASARRTRVAVGTHGIVTVVAIAAHARAQGAIRKFDKIMRRRPGRDDQILAEARQLLAASGLAPSPSSALSSDAAYRAYLEWQLFRSLRASSRFNYEAKIKRFLQRYVYSRDAVGMRAERTARIAAGHLALPPGQARVLSVGCRDDREIATLSDVFKTEDVTGLDIFSLNPAIRCGDMHAMPFSDWEFDVVVSCHSLEHAFDPELALREFHRVLKPGGMLAIEVPIRNFAADGPLALPQPVSPSTDRWDFCNVRTLIRLVGEAGRPGMTIVHAQDDPARRRSQLVIRTAAGAAVTA